MKLTGANIYSSMGTRLQASSNKNNGKSEYAREVRYQIVVGTDSSAIECLNHHD
jgi:hypothetical protein